MVRARTSMYKEYVERGSIVCLCVGAWNDGQATLVCRVGGTIRSHVAATNAIEAFVWFNELNEVPESKATGSTREFGTGHSTSIRGRERERIRVKCACHLRIGQIRRFIVVGRFHKARRQLLGIADLSSGTGTVGNGPFQAVGNVRAWSAWQEDTESFIFVDGQYLGGRPSCCDGDERQDEGKEGGNLVEQHGYIV